MPKRKTQVIQGQTFISFPELKDANKSKHAQLSFFRHEAHPTVKQLVSKLFFSCRDFKNELRHLTTLSQFSSASCSFPPILMAQEDNISIYQPFLGITYSSFLKNYHSGLSFSDLKCIFIQTFISLLVATDLANVLDTDKHSENILIETLPPNTTAHHLYHFQLTEDEFIKIEFECNYWVWLIDWASARVANELGSTGSSNQKSGHTQQTSRASPSMTIAMMQKLISSRTPSDSPLRQPRIFQNLGLGVSDFFSNSQLLDDPVIKITKRIHCDMKCKKEDFCHHLSRQKQTRSPTAHILYDSGSISSILYLRHTPTIRASSILVAEKSKKRKWSSEAVRVKTWRRMNAKQVNRGRKRKKMVESKQDEEELFEIREAARLLYQTGDLAARKNHSQKHQESSESQSANPDHFGFFYDTIYPYVKFKDFTGLRVFARTFIPKGTNVTQYCGSKTADNTIDGFKRPIPLVGVASLINTSINPNVRYHGLWIVSLKDIKVNMELLVDPDSAKIPKKML